jgi:Tol biopolymer transport system component/DNA-binding winged helix-turn-helix (wHTH) protein
VTSARHTVRFGIFEADLQTGELRRNGANVKLQEQPFQVLALLLEKPGEIVTKEELQERIWKEDTFVDFDRSLATAISKIRQALGDSASQPRFIETVPKRGYRFLAAGLPARTEASARRPGSVRLAFVWAAGFVVAVAAAAFLLGRIGTDQPPAAFVAQPVTSLRGLEFFPVISPHGDRVAFVRISDDVDEPTFEIWVQTIDSDDDPIRLTSDARSDLSPTWSPDGNYIAFLRGFPGRAEILRIPSIGGPVKKLGEAFFPAAPISPGVLVSHTFLDWSPDGRFLVVALGATPDQSSPHQLEVATGITSLLPLPENGGIANPAYAPNGQSLAYTSSAGAGKSDIWLQDLSERGEPVGEPRRLTQHESWMFGLDWTPDGREIIFLSRLEGIDRFWRVSTEPDEPELVQISGRHGLQLSIDPYSRRLVFSQIASDLNVWTLPGPLAQNGGAVVTPKRLAPSTRDDKSARFSPDGERIVFVSNRTGSPELWTSYADGSDLTRITSLNGSFVGSPSWSPNGQFIAFDANRDGPFDVYVVRSDGGEVQRVTASDSISLRPSWSQDGAWIYFFSVRSGKHALWKTPAGGGEALQVTRDGGHGSYETLDGSLYFYRGSGGGEIWKLPSGAAEPERVVTGIAPKDWTVIEAGICFVSDWKQTPQSLSFYDFATREVTRFSQLPDDTRVDGSPGLSVSPDGLQLVVSLDESHGGDIMLVEDFR